MKQLISDEVYMVAGGRPGDHDSNGNKSGGISRSNQSRQGSYSGPAPSQQAIDCAVNVVAGGVLGGWRGAAGGGVSCGTSRVICTHFYRKGMLDQAVWRADIEFTFKNLSPATIRGYQYWAIPYVRLMRKSSLAEKFMFPLAKWRAQELAYQMGAVEKGSLRGKLVRLTCEPVCWALGVFVGEQNWQSLWEPAK